MAFVAHILVLNELEQHQAIYALKVQRRRLRDIYNPFDLREYDFTKLFRISKNLALYIIDKLSYVQRLQRKRKNGLSLQLQVIVAIRFFAFGSFQRCVGQDNLGSISQPSVSRCITRVATSLFEVCLSDWVRFPQNDAERKAVEIRFRDIMGVPGIIGCIDGTQVAIATPFPLDNEEAYKNHHGYHSINCQLICDNQLRIMNALCFPGTVHDQFIFSSSIIHTEMNRLHTQRIGKYFLLADSGYRAEPFILTPVLGAAKGSPEERYTKRHCQVRNCIERCNGVLKMRWRCLSKYSTLRYRPKTSAFIVIACVILHNMCLEW
ncbi:putative nuclease HARBI1 [Acyrthosiphon pisum]|uniref:DDE Tnp4 domain-containing protein n=2 Tax=Acyrthosiphon pisum TaxID=7029 RepID=A0A8R2NUL1_ACYPI|nr:putative nuclease HARBI1 [Acyrthosiphon pisum]